MLARRCLRGACSDWRLALRMTTLSADTATHTLAVKSEHTNSRDSDTTEMGGRHALDFWQHCLGLIGKELPTQQFETWIKPLVISFDETNRSTLVLVTPNRFSQQWVKDRYLTRLTALAQEFFGQPVSLKLQLPPTRASVAVAKSSAISSPAISAEQTRSDAIAKGFEQTRLNREYTFTSFVTGKANQLARAAALQVAENPGTSYNPLFLYGGFTSKMRTRVFVIFMPSSM
jgi:hypothetical protein